MLYGGGDFTRTLEISTRCGQDADCNPSTAGGILGAVLGYDKIPAYWKMGLQEAADIDFFSQPLPAIVFDERRDHHLEGDAFGRVFVCSWFLSVRHSLN